MKNTLTPKQEKFCSLYIDTGNASEAYRKAYSAKKSKPETINRCAKELLDNPKITARIKEHYKKMQASPEKTILRLMQSQQFDIRNLYHDDGRQKKPHELDSDTAAAIVGIKHHADGQIEYKIIDIKGCIEILARHLGIFDKKPENSGNTLADLFKRLPRTTGLPSDYFHEIDTKSESD
jgi:hypothetical protein